MNQKQDILNTWILLENLNEGNIVTKDKGLIPHNPKLNIYDELSSFLTQNIQSYKQDLLKILKYRNDADALQAKLAKSGLALYFDIFSTEVITEKLENFFQISHSDEDGEFNHTHKFGLAIYLDHHFKYSPNNTFYTFSGYLKDIDELPQDPTQGFLKYEEEYRASLEALFNGRDDDDDDNDERLKKALEELFEAYQVTTGNFRFKFLKDIQSDDTNLHSFFTTDLKRALRSENTKLLKYLEQKPTERTNLDSTLKNANWPFLYHILQPKYYPLGRFPSKPIYALSMMQQVAVNITLNMNPQMSSVNGPPGTGKTTLLKDIFADYAVKQAKLICQKYDKEITRDIPYFEHAKMAELPLDITAFNVIVASSNNGAVQNIVKELPRIEQIDDEFIGLARKVDYFPKVMLTQKEKEELEKPNAGPLPYWGAMAIQGGASQNIKHLKNTLSEIIHELEFNYQPDDSIYQTFIQVYQDVEKIRDNAQRTAAYYGERGRNFKAQEAHKAAYEQNSARLATTLEQCQTDLNHIVNQREWFDSKLLNTAHLLPPKPSFLFLHRLFKTRKFQNFVDSHHETQKEIQEISNQLNHFKQEEKRLSELKHNYAERADTLEKNYHLQMDRLKNEFDKLQQHILNSPFKPLNIRQDYANIQRQNPWFSAEFRKKQSELFLLSFAVRKQFLYDNLKSIKGALNVLNNIYKCGDSERRVYLSQIAWGWTNFIFPVLSTTFASFQRMFNNIGEDGLANLFIDEAGQAVPQAAVGAIMRCKKIVALGDPEQLKPVLPLPLSVLNPLQKHYNVDDSFIGYDVSVQKLIDTVSPFGFYRNKEDNDWIGIPLWVHRRCKDPMFSICNEISYNNLMVIAEEKVGKAGWIQVTGQAKDKFVLAQAEAVQKAIEKRIALDPDIKKDIYIITPFRNVARQLQVHFQNMNTDKHNRIQIGTVHTFQGKEAKIVYLVLGADEASQGAANWVNSEPNLINVAVSRAKEEFYIVGDKNIYCKDSNNPLSIAKKFIEQCEE